MRDVFGKYAKRYDAWYDNNKLAYLSELEAIKRVLPAKGKGLEIGVGTGRFAGPLGIQWGVDPSSEVLGIARQRGVRVRKGHGEDLPFKKSSFDYAVSVVALSFVKSPSRVIKEAARVIKKNGRIVVGVVNRESFLGKHYINKRGVFYERANLLTPEEVRGLLEGAGFRAVSFCQTIFSLPSKMRKVHKVTKGFSRGGFVVISANRREQGRFLISSQTCP
jgi:SAM-dependent methyltransferase